MRFKIELKKMIRIFKHYVPKSLFFLGIIECMILFVAIWAALNIRFQQIGMLDEGAASHIIEICAFVGIVYMVMLSTGLYRLETCRDYKLTIARLATSLGISLLAISVILYLFPNIDLWRSVIVYALVITYVGFLLSRYVFLHMVDLDRLRKRVLVLGAGEKAAQIQERGNREGSNVQFIRFLKMDDKEDKVEDAIAFDQIKSLRDYVKQHTVQEIIVANQERRGKLPMAALLDCKMDGCLVCDAASFIEQQSGTVDLNNVSPSWMIFSDGFGGGHKISLIAKRIFDVFASALLLILSFPILLIAGFLVKITSKGPIFYRQERVGLGGRSFNVLKFRSMTVDAEADGVPKWAGKNDARVTAIGRFLRATRIDEIPQIFNVLAGQMSFVGPRPERPFFVEQLGKKITFYHQRHWVKPGITGWAQLNYPYGASEEDSKRKLEYDLYYIKNYSIFLDFLILVQTVRVVLWPDGAR